MIPFLVGATVTTGWLVTLEAAEISNITTVLQNVASSILTNFVPIFVAGLAVFAVIVIIKKIPWRVSAWTGWKKKRR